MKYSQLISETDYMADMKDEIINLLSIASSRGITNIKTSFLVKDLKNLGFEIDLDTIVDVMNDIDIVSSADTNKITLGSDNDELTTPEFGDESPLGGFDDKPDSGDTPVDQMAKRQATKDIKL